MKLTWPVLSQGRSQRTLTLQGHLWPLQSSRRVSSRISISRSGWILIELVCKKIQRIIWVIPVELTGSTMIEIQPNGLIVTRCTLAETSQQGLDLLQPWWPKRSWKGITKTKWVKLNLEGSKAPLAKDTRPKRKRPKQRGSRCKQTG